MKRLTALALAIASLLVPAGAHPQGAQTFWLLLYHRPPSWSAGQRLVLEVEAASTCVPAGTSGAFVGECGTVLVQLTYAPPGACVRSESDPDCPWPKTVLDSLDYPGGRATFSVPETQGTIAYSFAAHEWHCVYVHFNPFTGGSKQCDDATAGTDTYTVTAG
jgi:hypothetical protein